MSPSSIETCVNECVKLLIKCFALRHDLEFGPVVAKGCNAVVYSARWARTSFEEKEGKVADSSPVKDDTSNSVLEDLRQTVQVVEEKIEAKNVEDQPERSEVTNEDSKKVTSEDSKVEMVTTSNAEKSGGEAKDDVSAIR